jgi:hypothetical protein
MKNDVNVPSKSNMQKNFYLNEDEKTLEAMALVEMLVKRMLIVGSRVGTFTLNASGSSCRSATDARVTF